MLFDRTMVVVLVWLFCCIHTVQNERPSRNGSSGSGSAMRNSKRNQRNKKMAITTGAVMGATVAATAAVANDQSSSTTIAKATSVTGSKEAYSGSKVIEDSASSNTVINTRPTQNFLNAWVRNSVDAVQRGVDTFQDVSTTVFQKARKTIRSSKESAEKRSGGVSGRRKQVGIIEGIGRSMANLIDSGVVGMEQATDLGLTMATMGTTKIRSELDGTDGNKEVLRVLVKYVASRIGMGTRGSAVQFVDDLGTISTFMADDDDVTRSISTIMLKLMENPKASVALIRMVLTILESSPSTSCLLDQMPLSAADLRMLFDVFVGSNGQQMMKTLSGLLKDMTTGPDTRQFLQSLLSMMSMFRSDTPTKPGAKPENPTSIVGSVTGFLIGDGAVEDDQEDTKKTIKKKSSSEETVVRKKPPVMKKPQLSKEDEDWFNDNSIKRTTSKSLSTKPSQQIDKFDASENSFNKKTQLENVNIHDTDIKTPTVTNSDTSVVVKKKNKSQSSLSKTPNTQANPVPELQNDILLDDNLTLDNDIQQNQSLQEKRKPPSVKPKLLQRSGDSNTSINNINKETESGNAKIAETTSKTANASVVVENKNKPQSSPITDTPDLEATPDVMQLSDELVDTGGNSLPKPKPKPSPSKTLKHPKPVQQKQVVNTNANSLESDIGNVDIVESKTASAS